MLLEDEYIHLKVEDHIARFLSVDVRQHRAEN